MKNKMSWSHRQASILAAILFSAFIFGGAIQAVAYDHNHDQNGFRDQNGYHRYGYHHHHRGYWHQDQGGVRLWINV